MPLVEPPVSAIEGGSKQAQRQGDDRMATQATVNGAENGRPTVWGLTPTELHDRFWAARGVQVVRPGQPGELEKNAELFLLTAPGLLTVFRLRNLVDQLSWLQPEMMWVRLHHERERGYREVVSVGERGEFLGFQRLYGGSDARLARVVLTPSREIARKWQSAESTSAGWRQLRRGTPRERRIAATMEARTYDRESDQEVMEFVRDLIQTWQSPSATVDRARKIGSQVWGDASTKVDKGVRFIGPAWIGAGRTLTGEETVVGPAVLWDDPETRLASEDMDWLELEPSEVFKGRVRSHSPTSLYTIGKRVFDVVFALVALALVLPLFPIIMLAIYLEDGRPLFYGHRRESRGGKPFTCLKFRSMMKNADQLKARLVMVNQADGPQFHIQGDPRVTRVGRILRRFYLDELPQLFNVLAGSMSIVGPRPSPYEENQCCPAWREARLSVPPGITGLWQVMRTREEGKDFQEWIKYDIEYVQKACFRLDLWIIWKTFWYCLGR